MHRSHILAGMWGGRLEGRCSIKNLLATREVAYCGARFKNQLILKVGDLFTYVLQPEVCCSGEHTISRQCYVKCPVSSHKNQVAQQFSLLM